MAIVNGDFADPSTARFDADGWTRASLAAPFEFGEFVVDIPEDQGSDSKDSFEVGWGEIKRAFAGFFQDLAYAFFDFSVNNPRSVEDFEDLWGAGPAVVETDTPGPYYLQPGQTLLIVVNGGEPQTVTFVADYFTNIADARVEEIAIAINDQLFGADAAFARNRVQLMTANTGIAARIEIIGGTAAALDFPSGEKIGMPEGSIFYRHIEFGFADFVDTDEVESFEGTYEEGLVDEVEFEFEPVDIFTYTIVPNISGVTLSSPETFSETFWPDQEMQTQF